MKTKINVQFSVDMEIDLTAKTIIVDNASAIERSLALQAMSQIQEKLNLKEKPAASAFSAIFPIKFQR